MTPSELRALAEAAPARIWLATGTGDETPSERFYSACRFAVPALLDQLAAAEAECERLRSVVTRWEALGERHNFALREPGCVCTYEQGDSDCKVHPTCSQCGAVDCECASGATP